jgi:trimethylamine--corrinoid protein Co-methyltransferase
MFLTGQMARRYNLPMRTGGMRNGSKTTDSLSAYESVQTMLPAILSGGHFFLHSAGWLESGLSACFAKFLLDADQLIILQRLAGGLSISNDDFAFDAIQEVGPGGHFLGCAHTLERYASAFYVPETSDAGTYEQWTEEGSRDSLARASELVSAKLKAYEAPPLDEGIDEAMQAFIAKRKEVLPHSVE